mmetsp:Transcript_11222/g.18041  ORF Transcript_11222/g.18041 Transcript_11222/m.18041 type:complete len:126 (+) Transcript_11222:212-589(+)
MVITESVFLSSKNVHGELVRIPLHHWHPANSSLNLVIQELTCVICRLQPRAIEVDKRASHKSKRLLTIWSYFCHRFCLSGSARTISSGCVALPLPYWVQRICTSSESTGEEKGERGPQVELSLLS